MADRETTRREFLAQMGGAAALASLAPHTDSADAAPDCPNIILVLGDDVGYADFSCFGQQRFRTPNIDRLAGEGVKLTSYYAGSPVCAPSRCSLLTGFHTGHCSIRDNDEMPERGDVWNDPALEGNRPLLAGTTTLGTVLQSAGYDTAAIGKWGLGGPANVGEPNRQGFDHFFGYLCQRQAHNHYPDHLWRNRDRVTLDNPVFKAHQKFPADQDASDPRNYDAYRGRQYAFDLMLDEAVGFVNARRDRPFFLYFAPTLPHVALQVPEDSLAQYAGQFPETPYLGQKRYLPQRQPRAAYAAMVSRLDAGVGRLVGALKARKLERNTVVIVTSDNGATFEVGGYDSTFFNSNAPWRGAKQDLWEGGIRVPFVAWAPGRVPAGRVRHDPAACWDLLPTCAGLAGARTPAGLDGISIWPALTGGSAVSRDHLYWEFQGRQALRAGDWKLWRDARKDVVELYDLAHDPGEKTNVAASNPDIVSRLRRVMEGARTESSLFPLSGKRQT